MLLFAVGAVQLLSLAAAAPPLPGGVMLQIDDCLAADRERIARTISVELTVAARRQAPPRAAGSVRVSLRCEGDGYVVTLVDALDEHPRVRTVDLGHSKPEARGRLLGLAAAEVVTIHWLEQQSDLDALEAPPPLVLPPQPEPPVTTLPPVTFANADSVSASAGTRATDGLAPAAFDAGLVVDARALFQGTGPLVGAGVAGGRRGRRWGVRVDALAHMGRRDVAPGSVTTLAASASALATWTRSLEAPWLVELGLGARAGVARLSGDSEVVPDVAGAHVDGAWAGPAARVGVSRGLRRWTLGAGLEFGWITAALVGHLNAAAGDVAVRGPWVALQLCGAWGT